MCRHDIRGINHDSNHNNSIQHLSINQLMEQISNFLTSSTGENRNRSLVIRYHLPNLTNRLNNETTNETSNESSNDTNNN